MNEEQLRQRLEELFPNEVIEGEGFETVQALYEKYGDDIITVINRLNVEGDIPTFRSILVLKEGYLDGSWLAHIEEDPNEILYHHLSSKYNILLSVDNLKKHPNSSDSVA